MSNFLMKLARHNKRLDHLPLLRKFHYVSQTVLGEIVRRRIANLAPRLIEMTLTDRCQCKCVHCYNESDKPISRSRELTKAECASVLEQAAAMRCSEVCFTGGEPLLREDLFDLVKCASKLRLVPKMNTNGLILDREVVSRLKDVGLAWCSVSIDSSVPEKHDRNRRYPGCYAKAVLGLEELNSQGVPASITTCATREKLWNGDLEKIIDLGRRLKVETVRILFPVPVGGFKDFQNEIFTLEEREMVRGYLADPIVTMESPKESTRCTAAVTKINVLPNGIVTPCVFVPLAYGNVRQESLERIWMRMGEFDRKFKPRGKCPMCDQEFRDSILAVTDIR